MKRRRAPLLMIAVVALAALGLVACGGSNNSSDSVSAAANTTAANTGAGSTVSTKSISGVGTVLVDSSGQALYTNNRDSGMNIACTGECTSIWMPVMAPSSGNPSSSDQAVQSKLGTVKTNGGSQVTFGGKPLYSFAQDSPGQVTGNGVTDSFGGTSFTWTVASTGAVSSSATSGGSTGSSGSSSSSGYGSSGGSSSSGGGYGY